MSTHTSLQADILACALLTSDQATNLIAQVDNFDDAQRERLTSMLAEAEALTATDEDVITFAAKKGDAAFFQRLEETLQKNKRALRETQERAEQDDDNSHAEQMLLSA